MSLAKRYNPSEVESKWYEHWQSAGYFHSEPDDRESYTILMPPPNVTGILHMGHMLNNTIQDILIRKARLEGKNACWVPGTDHASIATEAKVVKKLRAQGIKKSDLSREEFLNHAWEWKEEYGGKILDQLKKMGASCDWERTCFTMDPKLSESVIQVFVDLYKKGKLYRGLRMTNWDPEACTVLSNEEVIYKEEQSHLYHLKYELVDGTGHLEVATTRPETILGDTAVAVHPEDDRYQFFIGKTVRVPLINREIPVIGDEYVDREFGTGALKITPAHDTNDYEIGQKHGLESIDIFTQKATIKEGYGSYSGLDRFELRKQIRKDLDTAGFLLKTEDYINNVGRSERTDVPVEPRLTLQWFVDMKDFAATALQAVKSNEVEFFPPHFINMYENWLKEENVRDWCISRQLWWGHQIPAWYLEDEIFVAHNEEEALQQARRKLGNHLQASDLKRDEDVLDTWFSSMLWPISVFDGFKDQKELQYYYPTQVLVTAWDIIFFWVARMVMAGYEWSETLLGAQHTNAKGKQPFEHVYFTGMVRDNQRRKMSKSLGNSPDALVLLDLYGADGVRFGMLSSASAGNDIVFDAPIDPKTGKVLNESKLCEQGLNFSNKMWNALRLIEGWDELDNKQNQKVSDICAIDWINNSLNELILQLDQSYSKYRLSEVVIKLYNFIWNDFCSWYLEMIKPEYGKGIHPKTKKATIEIFEQLMILLHPIMPFVTEEIWHALKNRNQGEDLIIAKYPKAGQIQETLIENINQLKDIVSKIRELRQKYGLKKSEELKLYFDTGHFSGQMDELQGMRELLVKMAVLERIDPIQKTDETLIEFISGVNKFYIVLEQEVNWEEELSKIDKDIEYYQGFLKSVEKKLGNERFVNNAPAAVVDKEKQKQQDGQTKLENLLEARKEVLGKIKKV